MEDELDGVDVNNLLNVKTYWVDAPSSSSYYQEGQLGWNFTNNGQEVNLLSGDEPTSLHFNRTNIIGVPGHPKAAAFGLPVIPP